MTRHFLALVAILLVGPVLLAQDEPVMTAKTEFFPLEKGAVREYKSNDRTVTVKVVGFEKVGDNVCARLEASTGEDKEKKTRIELVTVNTEGVYRCGFENNRFEPPLLLLKLPADKPSKTEVSSKMLNTELKGTVETAEKTESVKVPLGTYDAVKVTANLTADKNKLVITTWYAKNVGIVKQSINFNGNEVVQELTKYTQAGK